MTRPDGSRRALAATLLLMTFVLGPGLALAGRVDPQTEPQRLFHIERSKNANIVVYDALVEAGGRLRPDRPLEAHWEMLAEKGQRKKLSAIQRKMAYGFKARFVADNTVAMDMAADIQRGILVEVVAGVARATIEIDGRAAVLDRIYVKSVEGGFLPSVEYLDLFGRDLETGGERSERLIP